MAKDYENLYPIASRCGVFAKTDLQPLINDGAAKPDLAASIFTAVATHHPLVWPPVVRSTAPSSSLAARCSSCPNFARRSSVRSTARWTSSSSPPTPTCMWPHGAALQAEQNTDDEGNHFEAKPLGDFLSRLEELENLPSNTPTMPPLFPTEEDRKAFNERHHREHVHIGNLDGATGPHFLGIDAGSTTIKATPGER